MAGLTGVGGGALGMTSAARREEDEGGEDVTVRDVLRLKETAQTVCEQPLEQLLGTHPVCVWHLIN